MYLPLNDKMFAENRVSTLTPSVLIRSLSNLQVRHKVLDEFEFQSDWTTPFGVRCYWASKKFPKTYNWKKWCLPAILFIFDRIFIKVAGNQARYKISDEFDFGPDRTVHVGVTCPLTPSVFDRIFVRIAGYEDRHTISDEFDFGPDRTIHCEVTRSWVTKIFPIDLRWRKCCSEDSFLQFWLDLCQTFR